MENPSRSSEGMVAQAPQEPEKALGGFRFFFKVLKGIRVGVIRV